MSVEDTDHSRHGHGRRLADTEGQSSRMLELQTNITNLKKSVALAKRTLPSVEAQAQGTIDSSLTRLKQDLIQANIALGEILNQQQPPDQISVTRESLRRLVSHLKAANKLANDTVDECQRIRENTIEHMNRHLKPVNVTFKSIKNSINTEKDVLQANAKRTERQADLAVVISKDLSMEIGMKQTEISTHQEYLNERREEVRVLDARKKEAVRMMNEEEAEADRLQEKANLQIGVGIGISVVSIGLLSGLGAALAIDAMDKKELAREARARALKLAVEFDQLNQSKLNLEDESTRMNAGLKKLQKEESDMKTDIQRHKTRQITLRTKLCEITEKTAEVAGFSGDVKVLGEAFERILTESKAIQQLLLRLKLTLQRLVEQVQEQEAPAVASQRRLNRSGTSVAPVAVMNRLLGIRPALESLMASAAEVIQSRLPAPS